MWLILAVMLGLVVAAPAHAAFPGTNGKIAFTRDSTIWTVDPDGSDRTQITTGGKDSAPRWSPDGTQIAFTSTRADPDPLTCAFCKREVYVMDADGSDMRRVTNTAPGSSDGPSWSPDGTRLAFARNDHIWTIKLDGTDEQRITPDPTDPECTSDYYDTIWSPDGSSVASNGNSLCYEHDYSISAVLRISNGSPRLHWITTGADAIRDWSPGSQQLLFGTMGLESGLGMYTYRLDVGGANELTDTTHDNGFAGAGWSPDGERIVFARASSYGSDWLLYTMDASDGSNLVQLSAGDAFERDPDWQPIPINAYPRPKGASPMQTSLVPAYQACTSPNRTHGPPLAFPSCAPPQRTPGQLTIGTADSNGRPTKSVSIIQIGVRPGIASTPADEADLHMFGTINDVRLASDLADYTGTLEARMSLRITDKDNTPHPGGPGAGTTQDLTYSFPIPCSATSDTTVGGDCTFETTAEAFAPGIVKELRRSVWELGSMRIYDGGGGLFMTQGIFVP